MRMRRVHAEACCGCVGPLKTKSVPLQVEAASQIDAFNAMPKMVETVTGLGFEAQPHFGDAEA